MREVHGKNFSHTRGVNLPIVISEDTLFAGTNFAQKHPHTRVFGVRNGARLVLRDVNAINVTLPDEMRPGDFTGNNAQVETIPTGNEERPSLNLLCECEKCAPYTEDLRESIKSGAWRAGATVIDVKAAARIRRQDPLKVAAAIKARQDENMAACIKFIPQLSEATEPKESWLAALWTKAKALVGVK